MAVRVLLVPLSRRALAEGAAAVELDAVGISGGGLTAPTMLVSGVVAQL